MTEKELKKLNRYQLLELLVMQTERGDKLQERVDELEKRLEERELNLSKLGSIADAAVRIFGVFEASQQAADLYLDSAKKQADEMLTAARQQAAMMIVQAEAKTRAVSSARQEKRDFTVGKQNEREV